MNSFSKTYIAGGTIPSYAFVSRDNDGKIVVTTAATDDKVVGVAQTSAVAGDAVEVVYSGLTRVVAGEAFNTFNDPLITSGLAGRAYSANAAGEYPLGQAQTDNKTVGALSIGDEFLINYNGPSVVIA